MTKARFQIQTQGRNHAPFMKIEFTDDVALPNHVFVTGDIRTTGMIITAFKRPGSQQAEVRNRGSRPWTRFIVLTWEFIGGYQSWHRIEPTNFVEVPVEPNDPVRPERWIIPALMTKSVPAPPIRLLEAPKLPQDASVPSPAPAPANTLPVFVRLRDAIRALNEVLADLPVEPTIAVVQRKIRITVPLE